MRQQTRRYIERPDGALLQRKEAKPHADWREDPVYKWIYVPAGLASYQTAGAPFSLSEEQFIVIDPELRHRQLACTGEKLLVEVPHRLLHEAAEQTEARGGADLSFALQGQKHPLITQWAGFVRHCLDDLQHDEQGTALLLDHALVQLALLLVRCGLHSGTRAWPAAALHKHAALLTPAIEAMKSAYAEAWTLDALAQVSGMSKFQFAHLFKEVTGISPYAWLQLYRLVRSQERLIHTDDPILEVALACGFSSITVYNRLFRRLYRIAPGEFRRRYR